MSEWPLLRGAGSEIWHWLHRVTWLLCWLFGQYKDTRTGHRNTSTDQLGTA